MDKNCKYEKCISEQGEKAIKHPVQLVLRTLLDLLKASTNKNKK